MVRISSPVLRYYAQHIIHGIRSYHQKRSQIHVGPSGLIFPNFFPTSLLTLIYISQVGVELNSSMTSLQAEKERLLRSVSEKEAELSSLRQSAQAQQSSLQVEREKSSRDLGNLQSKLQEKVSQLV